MGDEFAHASISVGASAAREDPGERVSEVSYLHTETKYV
jgi:hypothetical protein